ncbi:hypothetical protein SAMN05192541_12277 [Bradyrhizobium arachidis]|nr:hypothetical protein SAMN05192541_12277 [Bradyrhizobium arachidis]
MASSRNRGTQLTSVSPQSRICGELPLLVLQPALAAKSLNRGAIQSMTISRDRLQRLVVHPTSDPWQVLDDEPRGLSLPATNRAHSALSCQRGVRRSDSISLSIPIRGGMIGRAVRGKLRLMLARRWTMHALRHSPCAMTRLDLRLERTSGPLGSYDPVSGCSAARERNALDNATLWISGINSGDPTFQSRCE